jgi:hypothetical protein
MAKVGTISGVLNRFGIEVEDVETVFDCMHTKYPSADRLQHPSKRPSAGPTANDPRWQSARRLAASRLHRLFDSIVETQIRRAEHEITRYGGQQNNLPRK